MIADYHFEMRTGLTLKFSAESQREALFIRSQFEEITIRLNAEGIAVDLRHNGKQPTSEAFKGVVASVLKANWFKEAEDQQLVVWEDDATPLEATAPTNSLDFRD